MKSNSKSLWVLKSFRSIQANLNNTVAWMASIFPLIPNSTSLFYKPDRTIPSAPYIVCKTIKLTFHSFAALWYDTSISLSFSPYDLLGRQNPQNDSFFFFLLILWAGIVRWFFGGSHFLVWILVWAITIFQHDQILISCTVPCRLPFMPCHV